MNKNTIVYAEATCPLCGKFERDADTFDTLVGWTYIRASTRLPGSGWTNSHHVFDGNLCPSCGASLEQWLKQQKKENT